jgi:catechol 2,3-dioxygenase-like lactoylglutathione lyase family enzyme
MKINAVSVTSSDINKTIEFYRILGFEFEKINQEEKHFEPVEKIGSARLMIDKKELIYKITGQNPEPGNHSVFAILYDNPDEVDDVVKKIKESKFKIVKEPWDAFWGQRYAIIEDPDGYKIDLYSYLPI